MGSEKQNAGGISSHGKKKKRILVCFLMTMLKFKTDFTRKLKSVEICYPLREKPC